ncbi:hypothetical protein RUM43_012738 [Polyplax serrata]|uniref:Uncharacterized protein n=1 Tax=Polyplax serrata TaxID=468196 RepID=A0AAN8Q337_POLSC
MKEMRFKMASTMTKDVEIQKEEREKGVKERGGKEKTSEGKRPGGIGRRKVKFKRKRPKEVHMFTGVRQNVVSAETRKSQQQLGHFKTDERRKYSRQKKQVDVKSDGERRGRRNRT